MAYLSVPNAARLLACSPQTIRSLIAEGKIKALRVGRVLRVEVSSLEDLREVVLHADSGRAPV